MNWGQFAHARAHAHGYDHGDAYDHDQDHEKSSSILKTPISPGRYDPRIDRTKLHLLSDILMIVMITTLCGCKGWDEMAEFAEAGEEQLRSILELPLHLVSAWATEQKLVLAQVATDVNSNEITAIQELLDLLDLRKVIVSTNAMGCQKKIAEKIIEKGGDYLFGLKGNQPTLQEEVLASFDDKTLASLKTSPETFHESVDKGHGRLEVRRTLLLSDTDWIAKTKLFPHVHSAIRVESERTIGEKTSIEKRVYLSSRTASAEVFANLIRSHWGIENNLHWVLDVTFGEDAVRIHRKNGAENLAVKTARARRGAAICVRAPVTS